MKKVLRRTEQPWTTIAEEKKSREEQSVVSFTIIKKTFVA
jgi:hypothetical protein